MRSREGVPSARTEKSWVVKGGERKVIDGREKENQLLAMEERWDYFSGKGSGAKKTSVHRKCGGEKGNFPGTMPVHDEGKRE